MMPRITEAGVQQALNALYDGSLEDTALIDLHLVTAMHRQMRLPDVLAARVYTRNRVLIQQISERFCLLRAVLGRPLPGEDDTLADALQAIQHDAPIGNVELLAWGWLYYRFVRVDLQITPTQFSQAAGITTRTLRRYQQRSIARLTLHLMEQERRISVS
ncbi:MAG: hypothetical protein K8I60_02495 [Anaerolineae bacterium]|nr:hypothetical protein [Anaerolineae bacterium]